MIRRMILRREGFRFDPISVEDFTQQTAKAAKEEFNSLHKLWLQNQDNYWKQISVKIGCPIPEKLPFGKMKAYVQKYIKDYKAEILKSPKDFSVPPEIVKILSGRPTIEGFLKFKEWKENDR